MAIPSPERARSGRTIDWLESHGTLEARFHARHGLVSGPLCCCGGVRQRFGLGDPVVALDSASERVEAVIDDLDVSRSPVRHLPEIVDTIGVEHHFELRTHAGNLLEVVLRAECGRFQSSLGPTLRGSAEALGRVTNSVSLPSMISRRFCTGSSVGASGIWIERTVDSSESIR